MISYVFLQTKWFQNEKKIAARTAAINPIDETSFIKTWLPLLPPSVGSSTTRAADCAAAKSLWHH